MRPDHYIALFVCCVLHLASLGQARVDSLMGKIGADDFHPHSPVIDSSANVVVLADVAKTELSDFGFGWQVAKTRYRRLLIRNRNGFDAARIRLLFDPGLNGNHKLASLRANTYNLEQGKVVQTAVDTAEMFLDRSGTGLLTQSWTFPALKEGSIIEFYYVVLRGSVYDLSPWKFQGEFPTLWSSFTIVVPALFNYVFTRQGQMPVLRHTDSAEEIVPTARLAYKTKVFTIRWEMRDVPAFVEEPDMPSPDDYEAGIRFQLSEYTDLFTGKRVKVANTWNVLTQRFYKNKAFGGIMNASGHWFRKEMREIVSDTATGEERAREIYAYVRDHFTVVGDAMYSDDEITLKDIFKARKGTVLEINLLLTAMLRETGLNADAVILSTRGSGHLDPSYPLTENLNYMVVRLRLDGKTLFLDASDPRQGFGHLPEKCYNGYARVISQTSDSVIFSADSVVENRVSDLNLYNNDAGDSLVGDYTSVRGFYESQEMRDDAAKNGENDLFDKMRHSYPFEISMSDKSAGGLKNFDGPVTVHYSIGFSPGKEDRIYFNPMQADGLKDNLTAANRRYPVEMPFRVDHIFVMLLEIPRGYSIEELPKPVRVVLTPGDGIYEYGFQVTDSTIQFKSRLRINRTYFEPEAYEPLRRFLDAVLKKEGESIVFRKKTG